MKWLADNWFKVGLLMILVIAIGLIAYYFMIFIPLRASLDRTAKENCVSEAQQTAIQEYEASPTCIGAYAPATCTDGSTYLVTQYDNAYTTCLQSNGLQ